MSARIASSGLLAAAVALAAAGCQSAPSQVALAIEQRPEWDLDALEIAFRGRTIGTEPSSEIVLAMPAETLGVQQRIVLRGLRGSDVVATGEVSVTPRAAATVSARVVLTRVACGAWCRIGETRCFGDAVAVCEQRDDDPCLEWSAAVACATGGSCSAGSCSDDGCPDACDAPPEPACIDARTLRTFAPVGACIAGACEHESLDTPCPSGCVDAECAVSCDEWTITTIDERPPSLSEEISIAIDPEGAVHVAYGYDQLGPDEIHYATRPARGGWSTSLLDSGASVGWDSAIAIDPSGGVHVIYQGGVGDISGDSVALRHAHLPPGGAWSRATLTGLEGRNPALAIDSLGALHLLFHDDSTARNLVYATRATTSAWVTEIVDDGGDVGDHPSLAVDSTGALHATYGDQGAGAHLYVSRPRAGAWSTPVELDDRVSTDAGSELVVDAADRVHVVLRNGSASIVHATRPPGGSWSSSPLGRATYEIRPGIAVDPGLGLHALLVDEATGQLVHAHRRDAGAWSSTPIADGLPGRIAIDPEGGVHVVFTSYERHEHLVHAYRAPCR
jgi:hypothetical protein